MPTLHATKGRSSLRAALHKTIPEAENHRTVPTNGSRSDVSKITEGFERLSGAVLLDDKQVSALTGYRVTTIKSWRQHGRGPRFLSVNGRPRVSVAALREWLATLPYAKK